MQRQQGNYHTVDMRKSNQKQGSTLHTTQEAEDDCLNQRSSRSWQKLKVGTTWGFEVSKGLIFETEEAMSPVEAIQRLQCESFIATVKLCAILFHCSAHHTL